MRTLRGRAGQAWAILACSASWAVTAGAVPNVVLDRFDEGKAENALAGATGAWYDPEDKSISCRLDYVETPRVGMVGKSLRLEYDIDSNRENVRLTQPTTSGGALAPGSGPLGPTPPGASSEVTPFFVSREGQAFNGYYSVFEPQDLTAHTHLIFWAKGDPAGYPRTFKIELKDGKQSYFRGYMVKGLTDEWRRFVIPLRNFTDVQDWAGIREFVIVFAADTVNIKQGALYMDDVYFADGPDRNLGLLEESRTVSRAPKPVVVDGKDGEWPRRSWVDMRDGRYVESGARSGARDTGLQWAAAWDDQALYAAFRVSDDEIMNGEEGDGLWKGDCVELYLSPQGPDFGWGDPAVFQLGFSPTSASGTPGAWAWFQRRAPTEEEVRHRWDAKRRILEVAVAWSFLKTSPGRNLALGYAVGFHDQDRQDETPSCKLLWSLGSLGTNRVRVGKLVLQ